MKWHLRSDSDYHIQNVDKLIEVKGAVSSLRQFLVAESPLEMMKNAFNFNLKALFVLKIFNFFCLDFLVMYKNGLIKKIRLTSKFMTSQPGKQTTAIHILPNISRSRGNQTMKFGQLIEYNMRNILKIIVNLEKSYIKYGGETIPRRFSKKSKLIISLDQ